MHRVWVAILVLLVGLPAAGDSQKSERKRDTLELRGIVYPSPWRAVVSLSAVGKAFRKQKFLGFSGKFKFKKLQPGSYTVAVFHPRWGQVRRTINVTPSFADEKGRVAVTINYRITKNERERMIEERNTVSVRELSIPSKAWSQYRKAREKLEKRQAEEAVVHLEKAVEVAPQFMAAWNELGTIAYGYGRFTEAEAHFRKALELDSEAFSPVVNLAGTLLSQSRFDEALNYNRYALMLRPDDPLANSQLGMNYFYLQKYPQALQHLSRVKRVDPYHFSLPHIFVAEIYAREGNTDRAIRELQSFLTLHPDSPHAERARRQIGRLEQTSEAVAEDR